MSITEQFKQVFSNDYCGFDVFFEKVLSPIFGDRIERKNENLLSDGRYRDKAEKLKIKTMSFVAQVQIETIDPIYVIDITVDNSCHLERARVYIKELVRQILENYSQAFIIFHHANAEGLPWRFSYIYKEDRQIAVTPAKRFTYVLGRDYSGRTAAERFASLQGKPMDSAKDFKDAFSVETLSDEFFDGYKARYQKFCNYLYENKFDAEKFGAKFTEWEDKVLRDYVKKMLGRLVFIQFLNRKGWAPNLGEAFKTHPELQDDFLDTYLEPLFGGVLNVDKDHRAEEFRRNKDRGWNACLIDEFSSVPYLNGGLFENDLQDPPRSRFPKEYFSDLFDFFGQYNFTIDENDPNDAVVGVDPEMLGRIFENLLEDNKDKGAFYTPKEIVQYMCRESLIAYLQTDAKDEAHRERLRRFVEAHDASILKDAEYVRKKIEEVKICDPAIGSGAFPMGLLNELVACREALGLHIDQNANRAEIKKHIIQNSIYGVDIEKGAVDIARLRFWLSIVVDEDEPQVLPNLDYKIMQGNSLLEQWQGISLDFRSRDGILDYAATERKQLFELQKGFYNSSDHTQKEHLRQQICQLAKNILTKSGYNYQLPTTLDIAANSHFFLWHTWFNEVFSRPSKEGFDIVIGNPPYIQLQNNGGELAKLFDNCGYSTFARTGDIYCLFYERGWQLLKNDGHLCYITSNKWMRAGYGEKTREFFANKTNPMLLIDFAGVKIFESATVDTNILLFSKSSNQHQTVCAVTNKQNKDGVKNLSDFVQQQNSVCDFSTSDSWVILSPIEQSIKRKIEAVGTPLKDWNISINYGIKTGFNDAFIISTEKRDEILASCQTEDERQRTAELIRPILRGRDIKRYGYDWAGLWLIYIPWHFPYQFDESIQGASEKAEIAFKEQYPSVYSHMLQYKEPLSKRNKAETGIRYEWYALQRWGAKYSEDFYKPKIVYSEIVREPQFYLDNNGQFFPEATVFIMTGKGIEALYHAFHTDIITYIFKHFYAGGGLGEEGYRYKKAFFEKLPIPKECVSDDFNETTAEQKLINMFGLSAEEKDFILQDKRK